MSTHLLGIDLGTSAVKAVLSTIDGAVVATAFAEYPIEQPQPELAEQKPDLWCRAASGAVREVLARAPHAQVAAIGL